VTAPIKYNQAGINREVGELKALLNKYGENPLFLSERQLLSSGEITTKEFEPSFEGFTLMEMVMANNVQYLNQLYSDLDQHTFSMIITKPINSKLQDRNAKFSKENNLWVKKVEMPVLESYKLVAELPLSQIEIYIPK
jgi:hypothetical protein